MIVLNKLSIRIKLILVIMLVSIISLTITGIAVFAFEIITYKRSMAANLAGLAEIMAYNTQAAITFNDQATAGEMLNSLKSEGNILSAAIFTPDDKLFAHYLPKGRGKQSLLDATQLGNFGSGTTYTEDGILYIRDITLLGEQIGRIYLKSDLRELHDRLNRYAVILSGVILAAAAVAFLISHLMQNVVTKPVLDLAKATEEISRSKDYSLRLPKRKVRDEVTVLYRGFNEMLEQIQMRDANLEAQVRDRTSELEAANRQLILARNEAVAAYEQLMEVDKLKTDFISTVSHELRTPLTSILGFAGMIQAKLEQIILPKLEVDDSKTQTAVDKVRRNVGIIISESERLTSLINDVLDIAKMEAGKMEWKSEDLTVDSIIKPALAAVTPLIEQKNLELIVDTDHENAQFTGDRDRLIQVMINLISNAVKFTNTGSVTCRVRKVPPFLKVSIIDTGIGIPDKELDKVFDKFKQVGDTLTDKPKGTGLGLPICREIVEHHGGQVDVQSTMGRGSTFTFTLPLRNMEEFVKAAGPKILDMESFTKRLSDHLQNSEHYELPAKGKTVLVVDDEEHIRSMLRDQLEENGYKVLEAANGLEAVNMVKQAKPDLITMDVMMPGMSGFDVAAVIKNDPVTMDIPIVMLSVVEDLERGFKVGVDRYFTKPVEFDQLIGEIDRLTEQGPSGKRVLIVDENASLVKTLSKLLTTRGYTVAEALNGHECIETALQFKPDMIILDAMFSNGHNIVKTLRFEKGLENVYFIIMGSDVDPDDTSQT